MEVESGDAELVRQRSFAFSLADSVGPVALSEWMGVNGWTYEEPRSAESTLSRSGASRRGIEVAGEVRGELMGFEDLGLSLFRLPPGTFRWRRGAARAPRNMLFIARQGTIRAASGSPLLRRGSAMTMLAADAVDGRIDVLERPAHVFVMSVLARDLFVGAPGDLPPADPRVTEPLIDFLSRVCAEPLPTGPQGVPVADAARSAARALLQATVGDHRLDRSLYARAHAVISAGYADSRLSPRLVAARVGVSVRTLQQCFAREGETVQGVLRTARVVAALALKADAEGRGKLSGEHIATAAGFGSLSAMYRALRAGGD